MRLARGALRFCGHLQFPQLKFVVAQIDYMTEEASELEFTPTFKIQKKGRTVDQFYGANKDILRDRLWLHSDDWLLAEMRATTKRENMKWPPCFGYFILNVQIGCLKNRIGLWSTWDQRTNCQEPGFIYFLNVWTNKSVRHTSFRNAVHNQMKLARLIDESMRANWQSSATSSWPVRFRALKNHCRHSAQECQLWLSKDAQL